MRALPRLLAGLASLTLAAARWRVQASVTATAPQEVSVLSLLSILTPPARQIDPRGMRFGAGVSVVVLLIAYLVSAPWLAVLVGVNLALSAAFGTRLFLPGRAWPAVRSALRLGKPKELEHEYPPRFAQALGGTFLGLAGIAFVAGFTPVGWLLVGAVGALQTLLATTGICVGCYLYVLRWWVPSLFARLFRRTDELVGQTTSQRIRYTDS